MSDKIPVLGIYGGTFSPPHDGHLHAAGAFLDECPLDKLFIVPARIPPHKLCDCGAGPRERLEMCRIAFSSHPEWQKRLFVSDWEINRNATSYTVNTVEHFKTIADKIVLLIGTDMLMTFDEWYMPGEIIKNADLAFIRRANGTPEEEKKALEKIKYLEKTFRTKIKILNAPAFPLDSTSRRKALARGEKPDGISDGVYRYICENGLYQSPSPDIERVKKFAFENESAKRFSHTGFVAEDCAKLARIFDLSREEEEKLVIAAWLHDITKELDAGAQEKLCAEAGIPEPVQGYGSPTLHAATGAYLAGKLFPDIVDDTVSGAIRSHTTGSYGMTLLEMLLCFADFSEPSRKYKICTDLREKFYGGVNKENRFTLLATCLLEAFDSTITLLSCRKDPIDNETFDAKRYLLEILNDK